MTLDGRRSVYGYESLARFRSDTPLRNPDALFEYAKRKHRICDLELACLGKAMESGRALAATALLFINIHPDVFGTGDLFRKSLLFHAHQRGISPHRLVLEITEQGSLNRTPVVLETIRDLREIGVRFAFDDVGVAYSHLPLIDDVRPTFLKIVTNLLSLARDFDCQLILEGIEHESTAEKAAEMGIPLGQGFLFAHPADASVFLSERADVGSRSG